MKTKVVLTGSNGMVGSRLLPLLPSSYQIVAPSHHELDVTNKERTYDFFTKEQPQIVIHAAAIVDPMASEKERGNISGVVWKVNVEGTKNICQTAKKTGTFVIYLSTGSVFAGNSQTPGPFTEIDPIGEEEDVSWYGWTKGQGERFVTDSIIRISRPIGPILNTENIHMDYVEKLVSLYHNKKLYALFPDQVFPLNYLPDIALAIQKIIDQKRKGIFHLATIDTVSPLELLRYICHLRREENPELPTILFEDFIKNQSLPKRFTQYCAIEGTKTLGTLGLPKRSWKEVIDRILLQ